MKLSRDEDRRAPQKGPSMTPMIDVTFQLLIFFMCTMQFRTLDAKLGAYLPKDAGRGSGEPVERIDVRVELVRPGTPVALDGSALPAGWAGPYTYGPDRTLRYVVGPRAYADLDEVLARLAALHAADPERDVTLDCRKGTVYSDVVPVLDGCIELGFDDVAFSGLR